MENSKIKLDEKDYLLLYELDKNARQPIIKIARRLGISKDSVINRIKKLENLGIISGYYTEMNSSHLGFINFRLYLKFFDISKEKYEEIKNYFENLRNTFYVCPTIGEYDINTGIAVRSIYEFKELLHRFREKYGKFVDKERVSIFTNVITKPRSFLIKDKSDLKELLHKNILIKEENNKIEWDRRDILILKSLAKNGKISIADLSRITEIPSTTILKRIKDMINKGVIVSFRAHINWRLLSFEHYKVDIIVENHEDLNKLNKWGLSNPNVLWINDTIGGSDFEIDVEVKNKEELEEMIYNLNKKIKIRKWWYHYIKEYSKVDFSGILEILENTL